MPEQQTATRFKRAIKYEQKLRLALCGPTGSGKTFTALVIAQELTGPEGRVGVIDTEHGSASLYSDEFSFDTLELTSFAPKKYIDAIREAATAGIKVLIIDSLSHAWMGVDGALDQVDKAGARMGGNKFAAWRDVTPQHNALVDAILSAPMHIICTMRSKMEYILEEKVKDGRTTVVPRKVGMAPIQRDGMEYEFTLVGEMDINHSLVVTKTRINALDGLVVSKPDKDIAVTILGWLHGETRPEPEAPAAAEATPAPATTNGAKPAPRKGAPTAADIPTERAEGTPTPPNADPEATARAAFWANQGKRKLNRENGQVYRYLGIPTDGEHPLTAHWLEPCDAAGLSRPEAYKLADTCIGDVLKEANKAKDDGESSPLATALSVVQPLSYIAQAAKTKPEPAAQPA